MWFLGTLPSKWSQSFTVWSCDMGRQKTTIEVTCDEANIIAIPFPYTYGKEHGSVEILSHSGMSNIQIFENAKTLMKNVNEKFYVILNDAKRNFNNDDIGWILADIETSFTITYKHKIHYSSSLWIPTQISALHYNKKCEIDTTIQVHNGFVYSYPEFWNISRDNDVLRISIHKNVDSYNAYGIENIKINTINWESSDDEAENNSMTDFDELERQEFLKTVGIYQ